MNHLKSFLFIVSICQVTLYSQIEWVNPYPSGNQLNGIYFVDSNYGWAVGSRGTILKTTDGGSSWFDQPISTNSDLKKVQFLNREVGWVVGGETSEGAVLKTTDGGRTWVDLNPIAPHSNGFSRLQFFSEDFGYISGFNGVFKTTNGGKTWRDKGGPNWTTVLSFIDSSTGFIANTLGSIYKTTDGADTWNEILPKNSTWFRDIEFYDEQTGWFIADGLHDDYTIIYKTTNAGQSWRLLDSLRGGVQYEIEVINKDTVFLCGEKGVLRTSDGGENWYTESPNGGHTYYDMAYINEKLWIVGGDYKQAIIQYSENQGWPWKKVNYNYTLEKINDIDFVDEQLGWFAGVSGTLFNTINGGVTWNDVDLFAIDFSSVSAPTSSTIYAAGNDGEFVYSFDFGVTWSTNSLGPWSQELAIEFVTERTGFTHSSNLGVFSKTTDKGQTWNPINPSSLVYKLEFIDSLNAYAIGWPMESDHSSIIKTADGFNTFTEESFPDYITGISFINELIGYISSGWAIYRTIDGGQNWDKINDYQQMQFEPIDLVFTDENTGVFIGTKDYVQKLLITKDGGNSFTDIKYIPQATKLFKHNNEIWIVGDFGMLLKLDLLLVNVEDGEEEIESNIYSFELNQNYPNPFNGMTTISYTIPKASNINMSLYNIIGQKIDEVINGYQNAGTHLVNFDASGLSSGVYIYMLTSNDFRKSKKFVLLK